MSPDPNVATLLLEAETGALTIAGQHVQRFAERVAEKSVRHIYLGNLPTRQSVASGTPIAVNIDVAAAVVAETAFLTSAITSNDLSTIIARYPVRESQMLDVIAKKLGFVGRAQYEAAVRKLFVDDETAVAFGRSLFDGLYEAMTSDGAVREPAAA